MPITSVANETAMSTVLIGTESIPGTAVVPDGRSMIEFSAQPGIGEIIRSQDATGGYDRTNTARRSTALPSATLGGPLTYQDLAIWAQYAVAGGVTGVTDGNTVPGYTYTFAPAFNSDDINTATVQYGVDGLPWQATGVRLDEFTISGDATNADGQWEIGGTPFVRDADRLETDDYEGEVDATSTDTNIVDSGTPAWTVDQFAGAYFFMDYGTHVGEVRQITSNDATSLTLETPLSAAPSGGEAYYIAAQFPVVADADYDAITMEGTEVYLDTYDSGTSTLGTTLISDRVLSFNVSQRLNLAYKRRASGIIGRMGRGAREVTGQIRLEFDRWDEYVNLRENTEMSLRIQQTGPVIDSGAGTNHLAQINIERLVFDGWSEDEDTNNMTVTLAFVALQESPIWQLVAKTNLATLP